MYYTSVCVYIILGGGGGTGLNCGGGGTPAEPGGIGGGGKLAGGALPLPVVGGIRAGGGGRLFLLGSCSLKLNWRKNSFVSLFQWLQKRMSDLSTSREGTWTKNNK